MAVRFSIGSQASSPINDSNFEVRNRKRIYCPYQTFVGARFTICHHRGQIINFWKKITDGAH